MNNRTLDMNKRGWIIPVSIVTLNALAITLQWGFLPEILPAHFDLEGNASGSMSRSILPLYPLAGAAICLISYLIALKTDKVQAGITILTSGICLVLLSSVLVTLTKGTMPVFMLAEPVILLAAVVGFIMNMVKSRKK